MSVISDLRDNIAEAFLNLERAGLFKEDEIPGQRENLLQTILSICACGLIVSEIGLLGCIWSLIYPLLTERGKSIYHLNIESDCAGSAADFHSAFSTAE
jgi:hypothetical protein